MNFIKPGWKTTEFKFNFVVVAVNLCGAVYLFYTGQWEQFQLLLAAMLGSPTLSTMFYTWARTNLKRAELVMNAPVMGVIESQIKADEAAAEVTELVPETQG